MKDRVALVTGATGFAGSHMMDALLAAGYRVRILVRRSSNLRWIPAGRVEQVTADVREPEALERLVAGVGSVFHFGGVTRARSAEEFFRINTGGTQALAEAFARTAPAGGLFLFCSSLAAGGPAAAAERPRRENDPPAPMSAYGRSKLAAERWLEDQLARHLRVVSVRPPAVYGPRDESILVFFRWARRGWLPLPAPAESRVSLVHGEDLAAACLALDEGGATGVFHVSDGEIHRWEDVGAATGRAMGRSLRKLRIPAWVVRAAGATAELGGRVTGRVPVVNRDKARDMLQPYWTCDSTRARAAGFRPQYGLDEGIAQTIRWYQSAGWL